ncbi:broad specificity phosphatase PhoE [Variovorax boronicumulans]|uniref:hypothetical protein n=1 Tax=Variovorax boronicumulans TaxID=436515 RepID=UPI0027823970|nr:hypothetical protein [Variovorax boronicumulans]MDQ0035947.1 broad specificity phosphatase PhoE [Variovorax boronicumulans]
MDERIITALRAQAWERAKGELNAMLATYWPEWDGNNKKVPNGYEEMDARVKAFIAEVEGEM